MSYLEQELALAKHASENLLEAFDKYYHDDVVMVEGTGEEFKGKESNRKREEEFLASVQEWHGGGLGKVASNESEAVTFVEMWMDVTFKDGNRMKMEQVSVKKWEGDQVIHERFYYNMPGQ
ncbi:MAG: SnoaL-like domain-containing protein [Bacteroidota bacterium]